MISDLISRRISHSQNPIIVQKRQVSTFFAKLFLRFVEKLAKPIILRVTTPPPLQATFSKETNFSSQGIVTGCMAMKMGQGNIFAYRKLLVQFKKSIFYIIYEL